MARPKKKEHWTHDERKMKLAVAKRRMTRSNNIMAELSQPQPIKLLTHEEKANELGHVKDQLHSAKRLIAVIHEIFEMYKKGER
jgi:cellobiose-specific phosphotransferase system component IIA